MFEPICFCTQDLADVPEGDDWLSRGERDVLSGLRVPKRRGDWRLGRWTVKNVIRDYLKLSDDTDLSLIEIYAAADGAPEAFLHNEPAGTAISISHSNGRSFCCAGPAGRTLGCDIELVTPRDSAMIADFYTTEEIDQVQAAAPENKDLITNLIWSAKESMLKALREGLRRDTRDVMVTLESFNDTAEWNHWHGRCAQSSQIFQGHWTAVDRFVKTFVG